MLLVPRRRGRGGKSGTVPRPLLVVFVRLPVDWTVDVACRREPPPLVVRGWKDSADEEEAISLLGAVEEDVERANGAEGVREWRRRRKSGSPLSVLAVEREEFGQGGGGDASADWDAYEAVRSLLEEEEGEDVLVVAAEGGEGGGRACLLLSSSLSECVRLPLFSSHCSVPLPITAGSILRERRGRNGAVRGGGVQENCCVSLRGEGEVCVFAIVDGILYGVVSSSASTPPLVHDVWSDPGMGDDVSCLLSDSLLSSLRERLVVARSELEGRGGGRRSVHVQTEGKWGGSVGRGEVGEVVEAVGEVAPTKEEAEGEDRHRVPVSTSRLPRRMEEERRRMGRR